MQQQGAACAHVASIHGDVTGERTCTPVAVGGVDVLLGDVVQLVVDNDTLALSTHA